MDTHMDLLEVDQDLMLEPTDNDIETDEVDAVEGVDAITGPSGDADMGEAQDAIRELLIAERDRRLRAGLPTLRALPAAAVPQAVSSGGKLTHVVSVDTVQSAAAKRAPKELEELIDDLSDQTDDLMGEDGEESAEEDEIEPIDLRFKRPDHDHNITAWKKGDDVNVSMRVLKSDGEPRVITAVTSHEAEMARIVACLEELGYTPDKIMRLPLKELASRLAASGLVAPTAKHAGAILGLDGRAARAPFVCGLVK